tara:strand:- start:1167 stop:1289 length:123 start_codon:yes stop_codon:yes gene_type:complete
MCKGLDIKFGIKPEKIKKMWKKIDIKPKNIHILLLLFIFI